jgi:hypothetical protein
MKRGPGPAVSNEPSAVLYCSYEGVVMTCNTWMNNNRLGNATIFNESTQTLEFFDLRNVVWEVDCSNSLRRCHGNVQSAKRKMN